MIEDKIIEVLFDSLTEDDIKAMLERKRSKQKPKPMTEDEKAYQMYSKMVRSKMYPPQLK